MGGGGGGGRVTTVVILVREPRARSTSRVASVPFKKGTSIDHSSEKLRLQKLQNAHTWYSDIRTKVLASGCRSFEGEEANLAHAVPGGGVEHHVGAPLEALSLHDGLRVGDA